MEKEEDESSRPSPVRPDYRSPPEPGAVAATPPPAGVGSQLSIPDTGPECGAQAESDEAQPGESLTPETEPKAGGEDQDGVAGESGSVGEGTRPVEERGGDELSGRGFPPQSGGETGSVSPQLVVDEIGGGEVSPIAEESRGIVSPASAMEGVDEKEEPVEEIGGDVTLGKEGDGVVNNSDSAAKEDLEDVNEDSGAGVEDNKIGTETGMDVAAHVAEETGKEVEADMMDVKEEETANEEKVMEVEEGSRREVEAGITDIKEEFETENVEKKADVVEETGTEVDVDMTDIKEGIEDMDNANVAEETQNYEEEKGNMEETDQAEAVDVMQDALMAEMAEDGDRVLKEVDEAKVEKLDATDSAGGEQSEEVELENTGVAEELGVTEQNKIEDIAEEAEDTKQMDKAEEMKIVEIADEQDKGGEEVDLVDGREETEIAEEVDKENEVEETEMADDAEPAEEELEEVSKNSGGKRKRGKNAKTPVKGSSRKKTEEDVCFICFDGGNLVLCDRRGCPKAYHPSCVNRDEAFFRSKGRWNCGWHLCSNCEKNAYYMCYTCTFSLCKGCIKDNVIFCVRGNKGFCDTCMKTVTLIERNEPGSKEISQVDFTDKSSWEYLFKDYFIDLKARLSITSEEIAQAKNPWKGSDLRAGKQELHDEPLGTQNDGGSGSDSSGNAELPSSKRRKTKKRMRSRAKEKESLGRVRRNRAELKSTDEEVDWASDELLEFVMHMKDGDRSVCSQYDVQALLLEYIKRNKLRDPRRKSQIICDSRLENLFGKPRVGHFEMLKLIESHFLLKEDSQGDELQGSVVNTEANQLEADGNSEALMKSKDKKRRSRKKGDGRGLQSNLDDYAAIDIHNINLIYLKRSLVEDLIEDIETFHEKVVGSFVRLRISGSAQKQDLYRLVQVIGTNKAAERYRVGKKETDYLLEILNLNKTEVVTVDIISNQEFTEDECKRLRQSIKCGLINPLTVGDIQEKALALQAVRVKDSLEAEITRLSHLRDRASDMGRRKELRECVEKLQLLKSPEERQRRLEEIPEIHVDPKMDPSYESEEESETDSKRQENYARSRGSGFSRRGREPISPREGSFASNDSWGGTRTRELGRSMSNKGFFSRGDDAAGVGETVRDEVQQLQSWEKHKAAPEISPASASADVMQEVVKIDEAEKMWHYQDPSGKIQGPFSINQLRKWNVTGYFPPRLRIWRTTEKQQDSILLTDALAGNFHKDTSPVDNNFLKSPLGQSPLPSNSVDMWKPRSEISNTAAQAAPAPVEVPKLATERWGSESNLPSPTPARSASGGIKGQEYESKWSPTPAQPSPSMLGLTSRGGNGQLKHSALVHSGSGQSSNISTPSSSTKQGTQVDGTNMSHTGALLSSVSALMQSQSTVPVESPRVQINSHQLQVPNSSGASVNSAIDMKTLQSLVQSVTNNKPVVGTLGWGGGSVSKPEINASQTTPGTGSEAWGSGLPQKIDPKVPVSTAVHSNAYGNAQSSAHNSTTPFASGNPSGAHHVPGSSGLVPSEPWRAPMHGQSNTQPSNPAGLQWGMGTDNQGAIPRHGPENQNSGWGTIPATSNMAWGGQVTGNSNQGWVGPGQAVANAGWVAPGQGQAPGNVNSVWASSVQGQPMANAYPGWAPSSQGAAPVNANIGWVAPSQGPPPSNSNPSWAAPGDNSGTWGGEKKYNGDRYPGPRDRGSQGGDSTYVGDRSWNRQSSFNRGGDSSRHSHRGQRVCKFHENGHCKKGAACDYLHT